MRRIKRKAVIGFSITCILLINLSGCLESLFDNGSNGNNEVDSVIARATPYLDAIVGDDIELRAYVNSIVRNCSVYDKECKINAIYQHVIENYNYLSDPSYGEFIQSPQETMQIKGGDCEDLAIFLNSLLENIGIDTYLVFTKDHAYSLAGDVDNSILWPYVKNSMITMLRQLIEDVWGNYLVANQDETITIEGNDCVFYGHNSSQSTEFDYESVIDDIDIFYDISSTEPIDFYVACSEEDFEAFKNNEVYYHYPQYMEENVNNITGSCYYMNMSTGIILSNNNEISTTVHVNISRYYYLLLDVLLNNETFKNDVFKDIALTSYIIDGMNCLVLDPIAGIYGYPGYEWIEPGEKIAYDSITQEYYYIEYAEKSQDVSEFQKPDVEVGDIWNYTIEMYGFVGSGTIEITDKTNIVVEDETFYVFIEKSTFELYGINNASLIINQTSYYRVSDNAIVKELIYSTYSDDNSNQSSSEELIYRPPYDIMQYPIELGEEWQNYYFLETNDLYNVTNTSTDSESEYLECMRTDTLDISDQEICCFVIKKTDSKEETGDYSLLWVSPTVGFEIVGMDTYENNEYVSFILLESYNVANSADPKTSRIVEYPELN